MNLFVISLLFGLCCSAVQDFNSNDRQFRTPKIFCNEDTITYDFSGDAQQTNGAIDPAQRLNGDIVEAQQVIGDQQSSNTINFAAGDDQWQFTISSSQHHDPSMPIPKSDFVDLLFERIKRDPESERISEFNYSHQQASNRIEKMDVIHYPELRKAVQSCCESKQWMVSVFEAIESSHNVKRSIVKSLLNKIWCWVFGEHYLPPVDDCSNDYNDLALFFDDDAEDDDKMFEVQIVRDEIFGTSDQ
uniref:Uncharacterized protein n=2 Tax=Spongospora subterranea TaxID=70186 RepID=A0A0H5RKC9_9EUKA|eukprot:CRZ09189.1 hypothetical protein [Spongospora subterranea]